MKFFSLSLYLSLMALPQSSQSADWGDGTASVGYFTNDNTDEGFFFGDFTLRFEREEWGAELGMFGVIGRLHETYAAATYTTHAGKLSFGFPRPSYDDFATSALTEMMPRLSLESIGSIRSRTTYGTMYMSEYLPYGARYSSQTGMLDYAVSIHAVPDYPDVISGGAVRLTPSLWTIDLAVEAVIHDDDTQWNTKAQVVGEIGSTTFGLGVFDPQANNQEAIVEMFGRFDATATTEITGLVRNSAQGDPMFGLGLSQQVWSGWTLQAGVFGPDTSDLAASTSLQVQF